MKKRNFKKIMSLALATLMAGATIASGVPAAKQAKAADTADIITNTTVQGDGTYIATCLKENYLPQGYNQVELSYTYESVDSSVAAKLASDTFDFVVFDTSWGGWNPVPVGPGTTPEKGDTFTVTVPISNIENALATGNPVNGFNLQTGNDLGTTTVKINSFKYVKGEVKSEPITLEGSWTKTESSENPGGEFKLTQGFAVCYPNGWNIPVNGFSVATFEKPIVAVTVNYTDVTETIYPQAEVLNADGQAFEPNYPQITEDGQVTYLTYIPKDTTEIILAYADCTVTKIEIYDEAEDYLEPTEKLTNADIIANLGAGWNLGNALESTTNGEVGETLWGNPVVNKRLFKEVAAAGFKSVRIPFSCISAVNVNGNNITVDSTKLAAIIDRLDEVVNMALDYDLFVVIDLHHDGSEGVTGKWLDVATTNTTKIDQMKNAFATIWRAIATKFQNCDQHVIFESMNEVMESGVYGTPKDTTWKNINELNQLFVETVRETVTGKNQNRFLVVPGYNTDINQTVTNKFELPLNPISEEDEEAGEEANSDYIMVDAHFYDPYEFTIATDGDSRDTVSDAEIKNIATQFKKMHDTFTAKGTPVIIGEFGAVYKNNLEEIEKYTKAVVKQAKENGLGYFYWDNGYSGENGYALWNRYTYARTALGKVLIPILCPASVSTQP